MRRATRTFWSVTRGAPTHVTPGCDMASRAPDGARRSKGKGIALLSGYTPPGGGSGTSRRPAPDATPPNPDSEDVTTSKLESLKAVVEALRDRLEAQEVTNKALEESNTRLATTLEELRKPPSNETSRQRTTSNRQLMGKMDLKPKTQAASQASLPIGNLQSKNRRIRALERQVEDLTAKATTKRHDAREGDASSADDGLSSDKSSSSSSSSSDETDDGGRDPTPPSSPSSSSTESTTDSSDAHRRRVRRHRRRPAPHSGPTDLGDRKMVIRPGNSRFKSLLDYRTYFLLRRSTKYTPSMVRDASKMNKRLDGAFQGQETFNGGDPLGVFTFLTTFRRACDAAGLTHGRAFPLIAFRLAGAAKRSFASAVNTIVRGKHYELTMYGEGVNWLLKKYATHAALATAYHDIITMSQLDTEVPRAFGTRVEASCDRLCGLFSAQDVKDVFINGLSDLIKPNVRVLDSQFPDRPMADTVAVAQGFWEGANRLRQSIKASRPPLIKVSQIDSSPATPPPTRTVDRPYAPIKAARTDTPRPRATDICYNCNEPGHFASQCPKPRRERRQARVMALIDDSVRNQINAIVENEVLPDSDEDESDDVGDGKADSKNE